ncbi:MAG: hypothetical protein MJ078_05205 [Clostridia bacterium]|nr:hypothetical protein [Clostridia bacterium]
MAFNREVLARLLEKNDAELWRAIRIIAINNGVTLPEPTPPPQDMRRLRTLLGSAETEKYREALDIVEKYRRQGSPFRP